MSLFHLITLIWQPKTTVLSQAYKAICLLSVMLYYQTTRWRKKIHRWRDGKMDKEKLGPEGRWPRSKSEEFRCEIEFGKQELKTHTFTRLSEWLLSSQTTEKTRRAVRNRRKAQEGSGLKMLRLCQALANRHENDKRQRREYFQQRATIILGVFCE